MRNFLVFCGLGGLFLGWNAPNHYPPWTTFHLELFTSLGLALLGLAVFVRPAPGGQAIAAGRLPLPRAAWGWLAVALWPLLQLGAGMFPFRGDALIGLLYGLGVVLALYVGQLWAAQEGRDVVLRLLFATLVVGGLAAAGLGLVQWLRLGTFGWWAMELIGDRPYANFAQPNHLGLLMVMAMVALVALFEAGAMQRRWVLHLALAFFAMGLVASQSRGAMLALGCVIGLWLLTSRRVASRLRWADLAVSLAALAALYLLAEPLQHALLLKGGDGGAERGATEVGARQWIWLHFWAAIQQRPWFGYGFNQAVAAMAEVATQVHPSRNVVFAHNLVLDLMTWFGVPAALAMLAALGLWMAGWLRQTPDTRQMAQRHAVFAIWLALLVQSMLEFPYAHAYFLLPAALLAGVVMRRIDEPAAAAAATSVQASHGAAALALAGFALLAFTASEYFRIEADFRHNRYARANFSHLEAHEALTQPWVLDQLAALNASAALEPRRGMSAAQIEQLHVLARRFHIPATRLEYAKALAINGRRAEAEHELLVMRSVFYDRQFEGIQQHWAAWLQAEGLPAAVPAPVQR